ncbi:MAG: thioredoxin family protein [Candidatus Aenigmatarchaeota archaeon]
MRIEVLGPGCPRCLATIQTIKLAIKNLKVNAEVKHVHDFEKFIEYGVMMTPAVVINGKLKIQGKIPTIEEAERMIKEEL